MKKILIASLFCLLISQTFAQHNHTKLKTQIDSVSYALGMNIASSLKSGGIDTLNYTVFSEALKDLLQYNHANMDGQLSNTVINNYVSQIKALEMEKFTAEGTAYGKQFDSSYDRGEPATFGVTQVIAGWTEALKMMPVGSKWELFIPYNLAYGERAMGSDIPAYSTLIFTIELLEIVP